MTASLQTLLPAIAGGLLLGFASALMLLGAGRIAGVSGIFYSTLAGPRAAPRVWFLIGLLASGALAALSGHFPATSLIVAPHWPKLLLTGLLVGAGTQLGQGCTSGHGLCGMANGSGRSGLATLIFMAVAALVVGLGWGGLR
jgi:uncharacterized membrane protein YedE/YeeE